MSVMTGVSESSVSTSTRLSKSGELPSLNGTTSRERILCQNQGGHSMPRGKKELAELIIPNLREVQV